MERLALYGQKLPRGYQAYLAQEFTSTARFGTSMSARRILGRKCVPRVGLFAHESGTRAGFRTSRDSSVSIRRGRRKTEGSHLQYERTEMAGPLVSQLGGHLQSWVATSRKEKR